MSTATDTHYMQLALEQARFARDAGEVPVGAVLVYQDRVVGRGHNRTLADLDPTAHAEILALRQGATELGSPRVTGTTLYVTLEPCVMCTGALIQARVERLVFGAREPKTGAVASAFDILMSPKHNHRVAIKEGVLANECANLLTVFFQAKR